MEGRRDMGILGLGVRQSVGRVARWVHNRYVHYLHVLNLMQTVSVCVIVQELQQSCHHKLTHEVN